MEGEDFFDLINKCAHKLRETFHNGSMFIGNIRPMNLVSGKYYKCYIGKNDLELEVGFFKEEDKKNCKVYSQIIYHSEDVAYKTDLIIL